MVLSVLWMGSQTYNILQKWSARRLLETVHEDKWRAVTGFTLVGAILCWELLMIARR